MHRIINATRHLVAIAFFGAAAATFSVALAGEGPAPIAPGTTSAVEAVARESIAQCEVTAPTGEYAQVTLEILGSFNKRPAYGYKEITEVTPATKNTKAMYKWTYVGGMRAGRMRIDDGLGVREPGGWLEAKDGKFSGSFKLHSSLMIKDKPNDRQETVVVEAVINEGLITGTAQFGTVQCTVTGRVVSEHELAQRNAIVKDKSWPSAQGPQGGGCSAQWTGVKTVDTHNDMRQVWRCEESDIGHGLGNISRFMNSYLAGWGPAFRRTSTGCASPIVAEGRLFFKYFIPAPRDPATPEMPIMIYGGTETANIEKMLAVAKSVGFTGDALPTSVNEKMYQCADDVVVCMDAATGKTLWKAVIKNRGVNSQFHKGGPSDQSPAYADGRIFALGTSGWIYAFDAVSGKPLWETQAVDGYKPGTANSNALLVIGNVLVGPAKGAWAGYDTVTGRQFWKNGVCTVSTLSGWSHDGKDFLIGKWDASTLACLEATNGRTVWTAPIRVVSTGYSGDMTGPGGITISGDHLLVYQDNGTGVKGEEKPVLAAYRLTPGKLEPAWQLEPKVPATPPDILLKYVVHGENVPVVVRGKYVFTPDFRTVELSTGKVLDIWKGPMNKPGNGGYMQVIEDIVCVRPDGSHADFEPFMFHFYKIGDDGTISSIPPEHGFRPIGGWTTSYHHPIFYPLVDGRMFLRQNNGIYCWDLRKDQP